MLPDYVIGVNVSSQLNEISSLQEENKKLKALEKTLDSTLNDFLGVAKKGDDSNAMINVRTYREKTSEINRNIGNYFEYQHIELYRELLLEYSLKISDHNDTFYQKCAKIRALYRKIQEIIGNNDARISSLNSQIASIRETAQRNYLAAEAEKAKRAQAEAKGVKA